MIHDNEQKKIPNTLIFLSGLVGISIIIIIHECGHFLAAHLFSIPTPTFSIGFGPALLKIPLGDTVFQIALLPFGGYVEINQEILAQQPYLCKIIVMLAGIFFNIIFAFIIYFFLKKTTDPVMLRSYLECIQQKNRNNRGFVGPIGLIHMIGESFFVNKYVFLIMLAIISLNIAFFNILPLPFLDGGKALLFTLETFTQSHISPATTNILSLIFFIIFILFISIVSMKDIKQHNK